MKTIRKTVSSILALALILALLTPAALADTLYGIIKTPTADGSVNLRARAGVTQAIVGWAKNGDEVEVLTRGNTWHRVRVTRTGRVGWVYGQYLKIGAPKKPTGTVAQITTKYASSIVNLRAGAGTKYKVIGGYRRGTQLEILSKSGKWYRVQVISTGRVGYVSRDYVLMGLSARTTAKLNMRTGAGTKYKVMRTLKRGQTITVLKVGDKWSKVQVGSSVGYVSNSYYVFK